MGVKKIRLVACKYIYCIDITDDTENHIKICSTHLKFQQMW